MGEIPGWVLPLFVLFSLSLQAGIRSLEQMVLKDRVNMELPRASGWGIHIGEGTFFYWDLSPYSGGKFIGSQYRGWKGGVKKPQTLKISCCKWSFSGGSIKFPLWETGNRESGIPGEWETFVHLHEHHPRSLWRLGYRKSMGAYQPAAESGQLNLSLSAFLHWI